MDSKQDVDPEETAELRTKNLQLKLVLAELQKDLRRQQETSEKELNNIKEENTALLTTVKTLQTQVLKERLLLKHLLLIYETRWLS